MKKMMHIIHRAFKALSGTVSMIPAIVFFFQIAFAKEQSFILDCLEPAANP
jgi:hypothetical protein